MNHWVFVSLALLLVASPVSAGSGDKGTDSHVSGNGADIAYDVLITNGLIHDGSGLPAYRGDVAISGDRIAYVGPSAPGKAAQSVDAKGRAVTPGFINMLSWATESLLVDGRGLSDVMQGITLEVFGEGWTMGPVTPAMARLQEQRQDDIRFGVDWTTLSDYLEKLERQGIAPNVASFIGATTVRMHELGEDDIDPTAEQLTRMRSLVRQAMEDGALGVGSSLIYAPASYAETPELIALVEEAARCDGMYISHMRSEGNKIEEAVAELIDISRQTGAPAEIYHLKFSGASNWGKYDRIIAMIEHARAKGLKISANMYSYTAGATGLDAMMPLWVQAGGHEAWVERLKDPAIRARVRAEMDSDQDEWENLYQLAGGPEKVLLIGFRNPALKPLTGKTLGEVAAMRGKDPLETAIDLVIEDDSRVDTAYFLMSEQNVRKAMALPWVSYGSDAGALAPEGVFLLKSSHPRAYGNFAKVIETYVEREKVLSLEEAVRKLSAMPAAQLKLRDRGMLKVGHHADILMFDPSKIRAPASFEKPHQLATGMDHVWINGVSVVVDGQHVGATPGRVVRGPGWKKWPDGGACKPN